MIRVLQLPGSIDKDDGRMSMLMNIYRNLDKSKVQFDFVACRSSKITYKSEIEKMGGKVFLLTQENIKNMRSIVKKLLATGQYEFLHYHAISPWGCVLDIAHHFDTQVIVHSHSAGLSDTFFKKIRNRLFSLNILLWSNERVAVSPEAGKKLFIFKQFSCIPNTIDANKFIFNRTERKRVRRRLGLNNDNVLIGIVGHIYKVKNQIFALSALKKICKKNKNVRLIIIGSGNNKNNPYFNKLKYKIKKNKLDKNVLFTGVVNNIKEYYSACDEIWIPSIFEGLPTVALEAQANGVPILISKNVTPILKVNKNIQYLNIKKPEDWYSAFLKMPLKRENNTEDNFLKSRFSLATIINQWKRLYKI